MQRDGRDDIRPFPARAAHRIGQFEGQYLEARYVTAEFQPAHQPIDRKPIGEACDRLVPGRRPLQASAANEIRSMPQRQCTDCANLLGTGQVGTAGRTDARRPAGKAAPHKTQWRGRTRSSSAAACRINRLAGDRGSLVVVLPFMIRTACPGLPGGDCGR